MGQASMASPGDGTRSNSWKIQDIEKVREISSIFTPFKLFPLAREKYPDEEALNTSQLLLRSTFLTAIAMDIY